MRIIALASLSLMLTGATPVTPSAQTILECGLPRDDAMAALKAFPDIATKDLGNGQTEHDYALPPGMKVFGFAATSFEALETLDERRESISIMSPVSAPYEQVVAAALKAKGETDCQARSSQGPASCLVLTRNEGPWVIGLAVVQYTRETGISCTYLRPRS